MFHFVGKVFHLGGDFSHVLLVIPRLPRTVIVENCTKCSLLWLLCKIVNLQKNMHTDTDQEVFA